MMPVAASALRRNCRLRTRSSGSARRQAARSRIRRPLDNRHEIKIASSVCLEALQHGFEHLERFFLVLDQRIVLAVTSQSNSLLEMVHAEEVIFPLRIQNAEHDHALVMAHRLWTNQFLLSVVAFFQLLKDGVAKFLSVQRLGFYAFRYEIHAEACEDGVFQSLNIPIVGVALSRAVLVHQIAENRRNVIFENQVFLIHALEQTTTQAVHGLALLVHYVVVFEQMFARFKVLTFNRLLSRLNAAADQLRLNRNTFFHA